MMNQLFLPVGYLEVMEEVMEKYHPAAIIYFTAYFILSLIICNLSLSIIMEWYSENLNDKSRDARKSKEESDNRLFTNILNRAMGRKLMTGHAELLRFKEIRFSRTSTEDHRVKLAGTDSVDLNDLKKCQKYSNIDLTKMYNEVHRSHKDVNMEVEFIRKVKETEAFTSRTYEAGETLFRAGEEAEECVLVVSGAVQIAFASEPDVPVSVHAVSVVGYDSLQPKGRHSKTCVVEGPGPVECLVFSQDNIAIDLDPDLAGSLMRMCFNSHANHMELLKDRMKVLKRKSSGRPVQRVDSFAPQINISDTYAVGAEVPKNNNASDALTVPVVDK